MTARRARLLFVQPSFQPPGGGNGVAAWMLQTLVADYDITVLTWEPLVVDDVNRFYGTSLDRRDLRVATIAPTIRHLFAAMPTSMALLRAAVLTAHAREWARAFDATVSANNEGEYGRPHVQYVHYPMYLRPRPRSDLRWYHRSTRLLNAYYALADRLLDASFDRLAECHTFVNSDWTGRRYLALYGRGHLETLHPPIRTSFPAVPWEARENGFVCIGRIDPQKRIETMIEIVGGVRRRLPDAHLHVVGTRAQRSYFRRVMDFARRFPWVHVHERVPHDEVVRLIAQHRFGLHAMVDEHFGMAPAEMICGGCLVWVHDSGGQVEIVERDPRFVFRGPTDAVEKICALLDDADALRDARATLARAVDRLALERFQARVRAVVAETVAAAVGARAS